MATERYLLIAEKPDLMRKIQACYEKYRDRIPYEITFTSQRGHLVTLKYPDEIDETLKDWSWDTLPIDPKEHGGWQYKVIEEAKTGSFMTARERYDYIKNEIYSGNYDGVINAGDPDQEGELLVRIVLGHLKNRLPIRRFWTNDLTESHILDALLNLRDDENDPQLTNLLAAAYGRQHADYLFGMNLSRAATLKMGARVACGRVKTPILAIVCKREDEIKNFVPKTVYGVKALYEEGFEGVLLAGEKEIDPSEDSDDEDGDGNSGIKWYDKKIDAENLISSLKRAPVITDYETRRQKSYAPKLFKLATAQIEAGKMGYSAADTLRIIQGLYEKKLLSYPRTGCEYLGGDEDFGEMLNAAGCVPELRKYVEQISSSDISRVKKTKTWTNAEELKKEGHSALVPTTTLCDWPELDKEEQDIYRMVCAQFVAPFLPPLVQDKTTLLAETDGHVFRSTGKTLVDPGWTAVFGRNHTDTLIPRHKKGDMLVVTKHDVAEKTTKCPKRYTTADLIAICENPIKHLDDKAYKKLGKKLKIGTPATRAGIIEELARTDKYLKKDKEGKREVMVPTKTGAEIIANIHDCDICKVDLTGEWEEQLEKVREGRLTLEEIDRYMMEHVSSQVEEFKNKKMRRIESAGSSYKRIGTCPICGKTLMQGPTMFYCTGYKEGCAAGGRMEKNGAVITADEFLKMLDGETVIKKMTRGKLTWEQKVRCAKGSGKITFPEEYKESGYKCPCCGEEILETPSAYMCRGRKEGNCGVFISKAFSGVTVPEEEFRKLFEEGKSGVIDGFVSEKTKKEYSAYMLADKEAKKIVLKYSDTETETEYKCPVCEAPLYRKGYRYVCRGTHDGSCEYMMPAVISKKEVPRTIVRKLLSMVQSEKIGGGEHAFITREDMETDYACPVCGEKVVRTGMWHKCADGDCGFGVYRFVSGHILTDEEIRQIFEEGKTEQIDDFVSKKKKKFSAALSVDKESGKLGYSFDAVKKESKYKCPCCSEMMEDAGAKLSCGCGMVIWKTICGRKLAEHELDDLIGKGETGKLKMKSKAGNEFSAKVAINRKEKKTELRFD